MLLRDTLGHQSLKELVVQRIRKAILDGQLELGSRLTETSVAEELAVSRGPVREAFLDLAREGLLEIIPRKGASVSTLAPDDIWQIYTLRAHLETLLIRHGLRNITAVDLEVLQRIVNEMGTLTDAPGEIARATELDLIFHQRLVGACPYPRLRDAYHALDGQIGAGIYTVVKVLKGTLPGMRAKHQPLLDAIRTGDEAVAIAAAEAHWMETAEKIRLALGGKKGENR